MIQFKRYTAHKDRVSASDLNRRASVLEGLTGSTLNDGSKSLSSGIITRRPSQQTGGVDIRIFEVQSSATGDGVYNCYEETFDATDWTDTAGADRFDDKDATSVEVLNLLEHHTHATYARALAVGNRIAAWKMTDDENTARYVGIPIGPYNEGRVMMARTQAVAGGTLSISVKLCDQDGSEIGSAFDVACKVSGSATGLNAAIPRLASGDYIFVTNIAGTWYCHQTFQTSEDCVCTAP